MRVLIAALLVAIVLRYSLELAAVFFLAYLCCLWFASRERARSLLRNARLRSITELASCTSPKHDGCSLCYPPSETLCCVEPDWCGCETSSHRSIINNVQLPDSIQPFKVDGRSRPVPMVV